MEIRELAAEAIKILELENGEAAFDTRGAKCAALGFLRGIAAGQIIVGQAWFADILINHTQINSDDKEDIVTQLFESGMGCDGQVLSLKQRTSSIVR